MQSVGNSPLGRSAGVSFSNSIYGFIALGRNANSIEYNDCWKFDPITQSWTRVTDFPGSSRKNSFVFVIDSFAYVGAGSAGGVLKRDFYRYNMNSDIWDTLANYPGAGSRILFSGAANGKGYVGGGWNTGPEDDFYEYNPQTDSWRQLPDLPFGDRSTGLSFVVQDTIYFGLGHDGTSNYNDIWGYSVKDSSWTQKASFLGLGRYAPNIVHVNGKVLVGGGGRLGSSNLSDYYLYDPSANQWSSAGPTPLSNRSAALCFSLLNKGYLFGGTANNIYHGEFHLVEDVSSSLQWTNIPSLTARANAVGFANHEFGFIALGNSSASSNNNECWRYYPTLDQWKAVARFPASPRRNSFAFTIDSFAYVGAGQTNNSHSNKVYRYNMNTNQWDSVANYPGQGLRLNFHGAANGKAYVGGGATGFSGITYHDGFYEFNPVLNTWRALPDLPFGNRSSGISFTIGDTIYFGQGYDGTSDRNDLWAYSVRDSSWTQRASFLGVPRLSAVAIVVDGKAIVGGGFRATNSSQKLSDYYEYDPRTNQWSSITVPSAATARSNATTFKINNTSYVFGGYQANNGYRGDLWEIQGIISSVDNIENSEKAKLYPNPSNGELFINYSDWIEYIRIYDSNGRLVESRRIQQVGKALKLNLDLPKGQYFIQLDSNDEVVTKSFMIH